MSYNDAATAAAATYIFYSMCKRVNNKINLFLYTKASRYHDLLCQNKYLVYVCVCKSRVQNNIQTITRCLFFFSHIIYNNCISLSNEI